MEVVAFTPRPVTMPGDLQQLCRQYLTHRGLHKQANTVQAERTDLQQFVGYLVPLDITLIQTVGAHHIEGFIDALLLGNGVKKRTAARKFASVKGLFAWAMRRELIKANPFDRLEAPRFEAEKVVAPDIGALLKLVHGLPAVSPQDKRDRVMLRLMLDAGLRVGGLLSLDLYDALNPPRWCVRPSGVITYRAKGGRTEETLCDAVTLAWLEEWLAVRHAMERPGGPPALFLSRRGTRPSRAALDQMIKRVAAAGGFAHLHCHLLRHARIGQVLEKGDIHQANYLAGHRRMSTTADMYGAQSRERMRERIARECPLSDEVKEVA